MRCCAGPNRPATKSPASTTARTAPCWSSAELDGTLTLLDGETLEPVGQPVRLDSGVSQASLGADSQTALALAGMQTDAAGTYCDVPRTWAVVDLEEQRVLHEGETGFTAVWGAMSPAGRHAAVSGANGEVLILDTLTGRPVRRPLRAAPGGVYICKFSHDGRRLVTASTGGYVTLWDVETALPEATVAAPGRPMVSAVLVDQDTVVISAYGGEAAWRWDTRLAPALELACRAAGRELTEQEWADSVGDQPFEDLYPSKGAPD